VPSQKLGSLGVLRIGEGEDNEEGIFFEIIVMSTTHKE
jgi:hypothetical protein